MEPEKRDEEQKTESIPPVAMDIWESGKVIVLDDDGYAD